MSSPWNSVLNTNYAPTDEEATQIRAFCEKPQQKVWEIDREIQQLRERLNDLLHERDALVEMLEYHRALVSPVRRLSPEMLQQIFFCCLPADRNPAVHPSEAPLLLGRICKLWNSTPRLWSAIHIVIPPNENSSLTRHDALRTWLGRSGATPLHISLCAHLPTEDILPFPFVDYIVGFSTRWASVTLALPMAMILRLCSSANGSVPILDTVKFDCAGMSPTQFIPNLNGLNDPDTTNDIYVISQFVLQKSHYSPLFAKRRSGGTLAAHLRSHCAVVFVPRVSVIEAGDFNPLIAPRHHVYGIATDFRSSFSPSPSKTMFPEMLCGERRK